MTAARRTLMLTLVAAAGGRGRPAFGVNRGDRVAGPPPERTRGERSACRRRGHRRRLPPPAALRPAARRRMLAGVAPHRPPPMTTRRPPPSLLLALLAAVGCAAEPDATDAPPEPPPIMVWADLTGRDRPAPDDRLAYGDHPLQFVEVWTPPGATAADPAPAVVMIHGGCWQTEIAERDLMNWIADDLRARGVGVWNVEYRGVDRGGGWPGTYEDVAAAADLFRDRAADYGLSATKVVVVGHSAGGHLALWLADRPALPEGEPLRGADPLRVDLAISQGGLPDLRAGALREGHPCGTDAPNQMAGPDLAVTSPPEMPRASARRALFHNTLDEIAPPEYARAYLAAVGPAGVTAELIETPGEGHVELVAPGTASWVAQRALILREFGLE